MKKRRIVVGKVLKGKTTRNILSTRCIPESYRTASPDLVPTPASMDAACFENLINVLQSHGSLVDKELQRIKLNEHSMHTRMMQMEKCFGEGTNHMLAEGMSQIIKNFKIFMIIMTTIEAINIVRDQIQRTIKPCLVPFFKLSAPRIRTKDLQVSISSILLLKAVPFEKEECVAATPSSKTYNILYMDRILVVLGSLGVKGLKNGCFSMVTVWYSYGVTRALSISRLEDGMVTLFEPALEGALPQARPHFFAIGNTGHKIIGNFIEKNINTLTIEKPFQLLHSAKKINVSFEVSIFNKYGCITGGSVIASI